MIIENDVLRLEVCEAGGEIASLKYKKKDLEVMWQGDEKHWKGRNPTLSRPMRQRQVRGSQKDSVVRVQWH